MIWRIKGRRELKPTKGSTPVHRFFPEKLRGGLPVTSSESVEVVGMLDVGTEVRIKKIQNEYYMRNSGASFEVKGKSCWGSAH